MPTIPPPPNPSDLPPGRFGRWIYTLWEYVARNRLGAITSIIGSSPIVVGSGSAVSTIAHATSGVTAGTYGGARSLAQLAVNQWGHVTAASNAGTLGTMAAFDLYVAAGDALGTSTTGTLTLALATTGVVAGTYANSTAVARVVLDAKGRVLSATNVGIAFPTVSGSSPISVATAASNYAVSHNTSGVVAGTYGTASNQDVILAVDSLGHVTLATSSYRLPLAPRDLEGTSPIAVSTSIGTYLVSHSTSGIAAGTIGGARVLPRFAVDAWGHVTAAGTSGTLGTLAYFDSYVLAGDVSGTSTTGTLTVALSTTGVAAGTYGTSTKVPILTVNSAGRLTSVTEVGISYPSLLGSAPISISTGSFAHTVVHNTSGVAAGTYGTASNLDTILAVDSFGHIVMATSSYRLPLAPRDVEGTSPILVSTSIGTYAFSHNTSGVVAGTYGTGRTLVQVAVNSFGHVTQATAAGTLGTLADFNSIAGSSPIAVSTSSNTYVVSHNTSGVAAGTYLGIIPRVSADSFGHVTLVGTQSSFYLAGTGTAGRFVSALGSSASYGGAPAAVYARNVASTIAYATSGTATSTIALYTMPSGVAANVGQVLRIDVIGTGFGGGSIQPHLRLGGAVISTTPWWGGAIAWQHISELYPTSGSSQIIRSVGKYSFDANEPRYPHNTLGTFNLSGASSVIDVLFYVFGTGSAACSYVVIDVRNP